MDAVLPLLRSDLERARRLLLPTLAAHAAGISRLFVIVPDRDLALAVEHVGGDQPFEVIVLSETEVVPERRWFLLRGKGWWLQQLIKLAMHEHVEGPFYLTLDCDLLCVRPWQESDLVRGGRAVLERDSLRPGQNLSWYEQARDVLGLPIPPAGMSVTPVVYSTSVISGLARHLELGAPRWMRWVLRRQRGGGSLRVWRMHLLRSIPWTEMSLYATYLEASGSTNAYHWETWAPTLYGNNAWNRVEFERWSVEESLGREFLFTVVGSKSGASVEEVMAKVTGRLPGV